MTKYKHGNTSRLEEQECQHGGMCHPPLRASAPKYGSIDRTKEGGRVGGSHYSSKNKGRIVGHTSWQTPGNGLKSPKIDPGKKKPKAHGSSGPLVCHEINFHKSQPESKMKQSNGTKRSQNVLQAERQIWLCESSVSFPTPPPGIMNRVSILHVGHSE